MWLYYCKLRGANDFESVNQLIVADKMFEMLDSETATHIGVLQGEEWYKPRDLDKQCDIVYASKGKSYDGPERAKWNDNEKIILMVVGVSSHLGRKKDVMDPPDVLNMLGGAQSEDNSLAQGSQDLRVDSGNVDETEVSLGILLEKAQKPSEDSQRNIT
ncbi:uncharacterized protein TNCV_4727621 [Trichonephila clavipes]|nr:uncharacterized protein TNCV_4727621 [Trichonephila clavipes]